MPTRDLVEEATQGEGPHPLLGVGGGTPKGRHAIPPFPRGYSGSATSTGPFAITAPSWVLMITSSVTSVSPSVSSPRLPVTSASRYVTSPSNAGNPYCTFEGRTTPSCRAQYAT